ncbi:MAG: peptidoglycan DD-metalloendopeptidase family protein [Dongiaceae bacterium]
MLRLVPIVGALAISGCCALHGFALAEEPATLEAIEETIESERDRAATLERESQTLEGELADLRQQLIAAAAASQDREETLNALESRIVELEAGVAVLEQGLAADRAGQAATLGALQRLALTPPEASLFAPGDPLDRARAAALLDRIQPLLAARAAALRADLDSLATMRADIALQQDAIAAEAEALAVENAELAALVERMEGMRSETEAERLAAEARIETLALEAADLRDLMTRLATLPPAKPAEPAPDADPAEPASLAAVPAPDLLPFPSGPGGLVLPVRGRLALAYGAATATGEASRGIVIEARPGAQVVVPFDGRVVFAGPFRGYGLILIVEHSDGYHSLLAGLARVDASVGQWVLAGEPAGAMDAEAGINPQLYFELRRAGQPVDPAPWLGTVIGG